MKKIIVILILTLLIPIVSAQAEEQLAGITPDSAFYGVDVFVDNARATLTPSPLGKAKVRLDIMGERMAEMEEMVSKNKTTEAKRAELQGQKQMQKFESSVEKIKKKDAPELNAYMQNYNVRLEERKRRMMNYGQPADYTDAIADAIRILEEVENVIVNIPEDLDPEATFKLSVICEEAGATTVEECKEMISSGALTATFRKVSREEMLADPHGCFSGSYANRETKWCCDDSDGTYSPEYVEKLMEGLEDYTGHILDYYYRTGTVEYKIINLETEEIEEGIETDSCNGNMLTEWFCPRVMDPITQNKRFSEEYDCPYGCYDGRCIDENEVLDEVEIPEEVPDEVEIPEEVPDEVEVTKLEGECTTDSDGGQDYFVKGTIVYTSNLFT